MINFGGFQDHSLVEWPGKSACIVFLRGCPLRCPRCINPGIQAGKDAVPLEKVLDKIDKVKNISLVMISGGECLLYPQDVLAIASYAHDRGLQVGIETSGIMPENLKKVLPHIDNVLMSIKEEMKVWPYLKATGMVRFANMGNLAARVAQAVSLIDDWDGEAIFATPIFHDNQDQLHHILVDLDSRTKNHDRCWKLLKGVYPDGSQEPVTARALKALAEELGSLLTSTRIKVIA